MEATTVAGLFDKLKNILMIEEEVVEDRAKEISRPVVSDYAMQEERRVVNGSAASTGIDRSIMTVHQGKGLALKVRVYTPQTFEQANLIANTLKSKEAAVVNYEQVSDKEQRRLCDFLNGCCYILGGGVQRISEHIVLYVPINVDIVKEFGAYSVPPYVKKI